MFKSLASQNQKDKKNNCTVSQVDPEIQQMELASIALPGYSSKNYVSLLTTKFLSKLLKESITLNRKVPNHSCLKIEKNLEF